MHRASISLALSLVSSLVVAGCQEGTMFGDNRANIAGAASVVDTKAIEPISVQELIDTINLAANLAGTPGAPQTLDNAIVNYEAKQGLSQANNGPWANLRNALQDRILIASQSRCGFYEEYLKRFQSNSADFFGSLSTVLGGAGAIVTGAQGARTLAGLAGIASGIGAEMQKDLFAGITSTVIVPGIEKRRGEILASIIQNRCQTPDRYTIGLALAQALQFHSACSMDVGIAEGGNAVKNASNPGAAGLASFLSAGVQINQAQSVRVSIDKNRRGGGAPPSGVTVATSISTDAPVDVSALLKQITDMSVSPCATTNGQPAPQTPAPRSVLGAAHSPQPGPATPGVPAPPTSPTPPKQPG